MNPADNVPSVCVLYISASREKNLFQINVEHLENWFSCCSRGIVPVRPGLAGAEQDEVFLGQRFKTQPLGMRGCRAETAVIKITMVRSW